MATKKSFNFCSVNTFSQLLSAFVSQKHKKGKKHKKTKEIKTQLKEDNVCFLELPDFFNQNSTHRAVKKKIELYDLTPLQYLLTV